jgi:hypothetical protein
MFGKRNDPSNWLKFNAQMMKKMEEAMPKIFKYWQVPIHSPRGSVIFWKSNTIHSAKLNDKGDFTWRGVVYVSMRPAEQYSKQDRQTLTKAALNGLTTNHWGNSIFAKRPGFGFQNKRSPSIEKLTNNPELLVLKRDEWTPLLLQLTGQPPRLNV